MKLLLADDKYSTKGLHTDPDTFCWERCCIRPCMCSSLVCLALLKAC